MKVKKAKKRLFYGFWQSNIRPFVLFPFYALPYCKSGSFERVGAYLCEFFLETADKRKQKTKMKQNKNNAVMKPQWISRAEHQNASIFLW